MNTMKIPKTPIIGFLAGRLDEPYQYSVWCGAEEEARRIGVQLVFFSGQRVCSPVVYEALDNIAFDLAEHSDLAGLIVMANVIGTYLSQTELSAFLDRFDSVPIISVGVEFDDIQSVTINNAGGMRTVISHLINEHGRCRFLFLAGPSTHGESEERKHEFLKSHAELLPDSPPPVVLYADFQEEDAKIAVREFLAAGGMVDAIVAANDLMAFGALRALAEAGINVPQDVSVTGYDDTENCRFSIPPLTTIRQPTRELGREALLRIAADVGLFKGELPQGESNLSFIIRQSCGCTGIVSAKQVGVRADPQSIADQKQGTILSEKSLIDTVNHELSQGRNPGYLRNADFPPHISERADLIITEGEVRYQAALRTAVEHRSAILQEIGSSLVSSFDISDILRGVANGIRTLGLSACWLALFDSSERPPVWARLLLAAAGEKIRIFAPYGMRFRTAEILPGGLPSTWNSYICEPLRFGNERLGYLVCAGNSSDRRVFEALRDQVSGAIKGALLMTAERNRERQLELEVRRRTVELSTANERLIDEIDQRRTLEHELLKISNDIMGSIGRDIHDHLCQDIAGIGLRAALAEGMLKHSSVPDAVEVIKELNEIVKASGKAAELAKNIARGLYPAELEARGIVKAVENLVISASKRSDASITLDVTPGFSVHDSEKALQLFRIIQEALSNAVVHSGARTIIVGLHRDEHSVSVEVVDNGHGIPAEARNGSGMGLNIMKYRASVITGELRIHTNSEGTTISCRVFV